MTFILKFSLLWCSQPFRKWKLLSTEVDWVIVGLRWSSAPYKPHLGALHLPEVKQLSFKALKHLIIFVCISQTFTECIYFIWTVFLFHLTNQKATWARLVNWAQRLLAASLMKLIHSNVNSPHTRLRDIIYCKHALVMYSNVRLACCVRVVFSLIR